TAAEHYLDTAVDALTNRSVPYAALSKLPVPVDVTDAEGAVISWNRACIEFAGRVPQLGEDRWCVTWRIYTTAGEHLPHDQCPMAQAIRERREIRGEVAIAMRPDGSRRAFTPYPTPLLDEGGGLKGAVNMLVDVSDAQAEVLAEQAERCRRLAQATPDRSINDLLTQMAENYGETADALKSA
ncbi:MAG: PAS domain-containing protein, partial [Sphingomicrobium sp.]